MHAPVKQHQKIAKHCSPTPVPHLDVAVSKQVLHQGPVGTRHAGVVDGEAKGQQVAQLAALHSLSLSLRQQQSNGRAGGNSEWNAVRSQH